MKTNGILLLGVALVAVSIGHAQEGLAKYVPRLGQFLDDGEGTIDGCHPNDWGMMALARAFGTVVRRALDLPGQAGRAGFSAMEHTGKAQ